MDLFDKFLKLLVSNSRKQYRADLQRWAQVEYSKEWQWAYQFMLDNPGIIPNHTGITVDK